MILKSLNLLRKGEPGKIKKYIFYKMQQYLVGVDPIKDSSTSVYIGGRVDFN